MTSLFEGERLKREGQNRVGANNADWLKWARRQAEQIYSHKGYVTTDHIRARADVFNRQPAHHNAWGGVFAGGEWVRTGYMKSKRKEAHARPISIWVKKGDPK